MLWGDFSFSEAKYLFLPRLPLSVCDPDGADAQINVGETEKTMLEHANQLKEVFTARLTTVASTQEIDALRVDYLGKKGQLSSLLADLKTLSPEERKEAGRILNEMKQEMEGALRQKTEELSRLEEQRKIDAVESYDESLPLPLDLGSYHPITLIQREVEDIFSSMGFIVEDYNEVVDDFHCFEALNIPKHHPARDMQDTYYLDNGQLLKTHTSAAQNYIMRKYGAPVRAIFPGRCFRNESTDACHENTFFQLEGMMIDEDISISNLIYFMKTMLSEVFRQDITVRLRPGFFPFVEPGFELDIQCTICHGKGCPSCKNSGWLELCPCGMIHPNVLTYGGIDTEKYTGFAFGLGLTRLAMMKYGIKDIRMLNSGSLKALSQFTDR